MRKMLGKLGMIGMAVGVVMGMVACQTGVGLKVGKQVKKIRHTGYGYAQIFDATETALKEVGLVSSANRDTGVIEGDIAPYKVKATVSKDSSWLTLEGSENERGAWKRDEAKGEWFLSLVDGKLHYDVGVKDIEDAIKKWSKKINTLIPSK